MSFKAAIFDLDGTIINSNYVWQKVDEIFFGRRSVDIPEDFAKSTAYMSFRETAEYTKKMLSLAESADEIMNEWYELAIDEYSSEVKTKPFVHEYIKKLNKQGVKIALATASPVELYRPALKNNGIYELFDAFTEGREIERSKEFPDIYLLAAEKLSIAPSDCIVFEDIAKAAKGAKSAGMYVCGVYDYYSRFEKEELMRYCDKYIMSFEELL